MRRIINPWVGNTHGYNCFGCNPGNPQGVRMRFYWDGEQVVSVWRANPNFVSWIDTLHGGIQATLLDELCGWVVTRKLQTAGVTSKMETRYRRPVLISKGKITISGHIREQRRNIVIIDAQIADSEGIVCTEATCTYFTMSREKAQTEMNFQECKLEGE